jgi:hypothetical protein
VNHQEARAIVLNEVRRLMTLQYVELLLLVDKETLTRVDGATGASYVIDVEVSPVNENDSSLVVTVTVLEADGRRWLPPAEATSFTVTTDDRVMYLPDDL